MTQATQVRNRKEGMRFFLALIAIFVSVLDLHARGGGGGRGGSHVGTGHGAVQVSGYSRGNGTHVAPHVRSSPDSTPFNNWSTKGNVNPYTGKLGSHSPYPTKPGNSPARFKQGSEKPSSGSNYNNQPENSFSTSFSQYPSASDKPIHPSSGIGKKYPRDYSPNEVHKEIEKPQPAPRPKSSSDSSESFQTAWFPFLLLMGGTITIFGFIVGPVFLIHK
jgi:hypothetical protein